MKVRSASYAETGIEYFQNGALTPSLKNYGCPDFRLLPYHS